MQNKKIPSLARITRVLQIGAFGGKASLYDQINDGLWTKGVKIGPRAVAWPLDEVEVLVAARIAGLADDDIRHLVTSLYQARKLMDPRLWSEVGPSASMADDPKEPQ